MTPSTRAELIGGVVYMPSPLFFDHGTEGFATGHGSAITRLVAVVDLGVATPEHAAFLARLGRA